MLVPFAPLDTETGQPVAGKHTAAIATLHSNFQVDPVYAHMREMAARNPGKPCGHLCIDWIGKMPLHTIVTLRCYGERWTLRFSRPQWARPFPQSKDDKDWREFLERHLDAFSAPRGAALQWDDTERPEGGPKCAVVYTWTEVEQAQSQLQLFR